MENKFCSALPLVSECCEESKEESNANDTMSITLEPGTHCTPSNERLPGGRAC